MKRFFGLSASLVAFLFSATVSAAVNLDFRATTSLYETEEEFHYTLAISDCRAVTSIKIGAAGALEAYDLSDATPKADGSGGCSINVSLALAEGNAYNPAAEVNLLNEPTQFYSEDFSGDSAVPTIQFESVQITSDISTIIGVNGSQNTQYLVATARVADDVDVSHVVFSVTGLRASNLRANGGLVHKAKEDAFLQVEGRRVFPATYDQQLLHFVQALPNSLSYEEITRDVLVLVEAAVADSRGRQANFSELTTLGDNLNEGILSWRLSQQRLQFTNVLDSAQLIPLVNYEFRGEVPLVGEIGRAHV